MALQIAFVRNLTAEATAGELNSSPAYVKNLHIVNEPKNEIFQYFLRADAKASSPWDKKAFEKGIVDYPTWPFKELSHHITQHFVSRLGLKHFPGIGAIAFYRDAQTGMSYVLAPVHASLTTYDPPVLAANYVPDERKVLIQVTPPENISYTCYRIVMQSGFFAVENTIYETDTSIDAPEVKGNYTIYAIGYNEDTGICSSWSNELNFDVLQGKDTWVPEAEWSKIPMRLSDLLDVNLVDLLNAQELRYNAETGKWENADAVSGLPEVTEADEGKFLRVVDGEWNAKSMARAEEASF